jgi:hypothetical protein
MPRRLRAAFWILLSTDPKIAGERTTSAWVALMRLPILPIKAPPVPHGLCGLFLLVWRVAMPAQDALDQDAQVGAHVFAYGPVDGHVVPDSLDQLPGDGL